MIQELTLKNFKSFGEAPTPPPDSGAVQKDWAGEKIKFGGLSLIIGTNASGKSNIRDALRFIHGISRGYTLAEVIGEKYVEGGVLQWKGIRGGVRETVTRNGQPGKLEIHDRHSDPVDSPKTEVAKRSIQLRWMQGTRITHL